MSEKSFAIGSVAVALVWGAFFYPPPPAPRAQPTVVRSATLRQQAALRPAALRERDWWRKKIAQLKAAAAMHP